MWNISASHRLEVPESVASLRRISSIILDSQFNDSKVKQLTGYLRLTSVGFSYLKITQDKTHFHMTSLSLSQKSYINWSLNRDVLEQIPTSNILKNQKQTYFQDDFQDGICPKLSWSDSIPFFRYCSAQIWVNLREFKCEVQRNLWAVAWGFTLPHFRRKAVRFVCKKGHPFALFPHAFFSQNQWHCQLHIVVWVLRCGLWVGICVVRWG